MIDQINELPEEGLKSSPKTSRYTKKINGLVEKIKISCTSYILMLDVVRTYNNSNYKLT